MLKAIGDDDANVSGQDIYGKVGTYCEAELIAKSQVFWPLIINPKVLKATFNLNGPKLSFW